MTLGSIQPLTEMSTGGKGGRCIRLTTLPPSCAVVMKSGNLTSWNPCHSRPVTELFYLTLIKVKNLVWKLPASRCLFIDFSINTIHWIIVYLFVLNIHHDMFRSVIAAINGQCYSYVKDKNWGRGICFTIKIQACSLVSIPNNGIIKYISIL
jgi:hypothetical protein